MEVNNFNSVDKKTLKKYSAYILITCVGIFLGVILKLFVIDILHVSGKSMQPSIEDGEVILVNKLAYGLNKPYGEKSFFNWSEPKVGDVVIYLYDNKIVVKRCVATEGTLLEYSDNPLYTLKIGEKEISLTAEQYDNLKSSPKVPDGYILAVGDNYRESIDSRNYGFVSVRNILGKVLCK
ncbi:signal peptidase I [Treponema zioleckii]|uniref:signal peptidase I n=1 Tax=Treponema zioleckii TaxID=331680 RepID=UPI00168BD11C|nr:signal peptidase I [Treponema zioleckii]